jgi:hypothetical protein
LAGAFRHGGLDDGSRQDPEALMKRRLKKKIKSIKVDTNNIKKDRQIVLGLNSVKSDGRVWDLNQHTDATIG